MLQRFFGLILIALFIFLAISMLSFSPAEGASALIFPSSEKVGNLCGPLGARCAFHLFSVFGFAAYFLLIPLFFGIVIFLRGRFVDQIPLRLVGIVLIMSGFSTLFAFLFMGKSSALVVGPGGYLGSCIKYGLCEHFALVGSYIFLSSLILGGMILTCEYTIIRIVLWMFGITPLGEGLVAKLKGRSPGEEIAIIPKVEISGPVKFPSAGIARSREEKTAPDFTPLEEHAEDKNISGEMDCEPQIIFKEFRSEESLPSPPEEDSENEPGEFPKEKSGIFGWLKKGNVPEKSTPESEFQENPYDEYESGEDFREKNYSLPGLDLLIPAAPFNYEVFENTVRKQAKMLEKSFFDFGFNIRVVEIQTGPVIAQFEVQLERGLRLNKILGLTDDLAIALKVPSVRIVAPIPGKNTVGVEVPNEDRQLVRLREVLEETLEQSEKMHIPIFLGKDVGGAPMVSDLTKLPHLLIAGRTGTGKSVCLNTIIVSMLMTRTPEEVRMILIDPKMVEMSQYKTIPHLMHPVVTDMKKAEAILGWAVEKMEERYQILARAGVRQLSEYNRLSEEELYRRVQPESEEEWSMIPRSLPYMVIVADEMADLMMTSAKEVETHIIRLAQKSRAVGIHLVLATQKPTVDIITGLIKSNLPARIAFEVASRSDSQVVLDRNGAEKLLGNGDMLFLRPGTSQVIRGQGTYVSDGEIESIVEAIATDEPEYAEELVALKTDEEDEEIEDASKGKDDLYEEAVEFVIREGRGSLSLLQRRFSIGYSRAARMIDQMAEDGVVGPYNGSKSRAVITTLHDWRKKKEEHREIVEHAISSRPSSPDSPRNFHGGENREENFNTGISGRENPKNPGKPRRKKLSVMRNSGSPNPSRGHFTNDPGESDPHGTGYPSSASVVPELREERVRIEPPGKIIKLTESEHYDGEKERRPNSPHETDFYKEEDSPYENPSFESDYEEESEGETWEFVDEYGDYDEEEWTEEENEGDSGENEYPGEYGEEYESEYEEKYEEY